MFPVDAFRSTLGKIMDILHRHNIRFHLTGGITSVAYGEPRMTQDVDMVIDNHAVVQQLESFLESLHSSDFVYDEETIRSAVSGSRMFQLLDSVEVMKLDMYPRELIPGELERSVQIEIFEGIAVPMASLPDTALAKLIWIAKGSHKNRRDLRQLWRISAPDQRRTIEHLALELGLGDLLSEVMAESDEIAG